MPTFTIAGTVSFPLADEATPAERPLSAALIYTQRNIQDVEFTGIQLDVSLMGRVEDAKACYVEVTAGEVELIINGGASPLSVSADGGFFIWFNPNGGLTTLTATSAANAVVRVYLFS